MNIYNLFSQIFEGQKGPLTKLKKFFNEIKKNLTRTLTKRPDFGSIHVDYHTTG